VNHAPTPGYEDLRITAFAPRLSAPVQADFAGPAAYPVQAWQFANNNTERGLNGVSQVPHAWQGLNTPIYMHLHMSTTNAVAAGVDLGFFISLLVQKISDPLVSAYAPAAPFWVHKVVPLGGYGAKTHVITEEVPIAAVNLHYSAALLVYVFRHKGAVVATENAGVVTEAVDDVLWLHEVDFHVQRSGYGTVTPT
jgi:hypothetical protein